MTYQFRFIAQPAEFQNGMVMVKLFKAPLADETLCDGGKD